MIKYDLPVCLFLSEWEEMKALHTSPKVIFVGHVLVTGK